MRLEWLEDILAIAQTGSFSGAAERRNLTQSAFSRRIQQIEDHVGVELFDRTRKPVQLRPTTQAQGAQIEQISAALRQLITDLRRGDPVTLVSGAGGIEVRMAGRAMGAAGVAEAVAVENLSSRRVVHGVVMANGEVRVGGR